jgi:hypothetical protein
MNGSGANVNQELTMLSRKGNAPGKTAGFLKIFLGKAPDLLIYSPYFQIADAKGKTKIP